MHIRKRGDAGGSAGSGGFSFQESLAAWVAVGILAEQAVSPRWGLEPAVHYTELRCETGLPVDDLLLVTSEEGGIYFQVKRNLTLTTDIDSDLGSTLTQFVQHFLAQRQQTGGEHPWERPLDPTRDRLVLLTDSMKAPQWAKTHVPALLDRFRRDMGFTSLLDAPRNKDEKNAAEVLLGHVNRAWKNLRGIEPTPGDQRELFALVRLDQLDVRVDGLDGSDDFAAMDALRQAILVDPTEAENAFKLIKGYCRVLVNSRGGTRRAELQKELMRNQILVRSALSTEPDLVRLQQYTERILGRSEELSVVEMDGLKVKIKRGVVGGAR